MCVTIGTVAAPNNLQACPCRPKVEFITYFIWNVRVRLVDQNEVSKLNEAKQLEKFVSILVCFEFNFNPAMGKQLDPAPSKKYSSTSP